MKTINKTSLAIAIGTLLVSGLVSTVSYAEEAAAPAAEPTSLEASNPTAAPAPAAEPVKKAKKVKKHHKVKKAKKAKAAATEAAPEAAPAQ
jgi:hypothetical protein